MSGFAFWFLVLALLSSKTKNQSLTYLSPPADLTAPADADGVYTDELDNVTTVHFDSWGLPLEITDPENNSVTYERNEKGNPTKLTIPDPDGAGPLGDLVTTMTYDSSGYNMTGMTLPDSSTRAWEYDSTFNKITKYTDELGRITLYTVNSSTGNVTKMSRVVGNIDDFEVRRYRYHVYVPSFADDVRDLPGGLLVDVMDHLGVGSATPTRTTTRRMVRPGGDDHVDGETEETMVTYGDDAARQRHVDRRWAGQ